MLTALLIIWAAIATIGWMKWKVALKLLLYVLLRKGIEPPLNEEIAAYRKDFEKDWIREWFGFDEEYEKTHREIEGMKG